MTQATCAQLEQITVGKEMYRLNQPSPLSPLSDEKFKRRTESCGNPKIYAI